MVTIIDPTTKAEWSPRGLPRAYGGSKKIVTLSVRMRRAIARVFRRQHDWLARGSNWMRIIDDARLIPWIAREDATQERILMADPGDFDQFADDFAVAMSPVLTDAVNAGGDAAIREAKSVLRIVIGVDWKMSNPDAVRFIEQHGLDLSRTVFGVTRAKLRLVIARGLDEGLSTKEIRDRVLATADDMSTVRARMIAQTETIRAQAEGAKIGYRQIGIGRIRWLDERPRHCPICARLHGQEIDFASGERFIDPETGIGYDGPPAHVGCQCAIRSVITPSTMVNAA